MTKTSISTLEKRIIKLQSKLWNVQDKLLKTQIALHEAKIEKMKTRRK